MLAAVLAASAIASPASTAIVEAVDAASRMADQSLEAQFLKGSLSYSAPTLLGGRIAGGRRLRWPWSCTNLNGYPYTIFVGSEKRALNISAVIKDGQGKVISRASQVGTSQVLSLTPKNQAQYFLEIDAEESDSVKSAQVAAVFLEANGKTNFRSSDLRSLVRKLMTQTQEGLDMGQDYVSGKNIFAVCLSAHQLSWTHSVYFESMPRNAVAVVAANRGEYTSAIRDASGPNPQTWENGVDVGSNTQVLANATPADLKDVSIFVHNKARSDSLFMVGVVK